MNIFMIGGGGREHALIWKISQSRKVDKIWCAPGNGGIAALAECVPLKATDISGILAFAKEKHPDLVFVAPDDPLALGLVDELEAVGIRAFGPRKNAAVIEASKSFAKDLMRKYDIPTAAYAVFDDAAAARAYIEQQGAPIVVKADGLALGKGVTVAMTVEEAIEASDAAFAGAFGNAGARVVIEEYMTGVEASVLCFVDGEHWVAMPAAQDHKPVFDGNRGPNTGGMGAFAPSRAYTKDIAEITERTIIAPTIRAMAAEGRPFHGVLYFGLMMTPTGPRVVEYNARFGDPETQCLMPLLKSDLVPILEACIDGTLDHVNVEWHDGACACVVLASGGYPGSYEKGLPIHGIGKLPRDVAAFHAGTARKDGAIVTAGGRVIGITARGETLNDALAHAYEGVKCVSFDGMHYRTDIGQIG
ncbi:MAG: phosphoribosylamine--glycine ligase [Clostridiaceae bacterium]|nr:phosphoribosylamine--glycine ligase [Clostridiaceae bacterium]